tara:strand:+ start:112 stop:831 length:720 start_codon:yes stop_codon:yes gene_type:complete
VRGKRILKNGVLAGYVKQKDGSWKWRFISGPRKGGDMNIRKKISCFGNNTENNSNSKIYFRRSLLSGGMFGKKDFKIYNNHILEEMMILQCGFHSVLIIKMVNPDDESNKYFLYEYGDLNGEGKVICLDLTNIIRNNNMVNNDILNIINNTKNVSIIGCVASITQKFKIIKYIEYNLHNNKKYFKELNNILFKFQNKHPEYNFVCSLSKYPKKANCQSFVKCIWKYFNDEKISRITLTP